MKNKINTTQNLINTTCIPFFSETNFEDISSTSKNPNFTLNPFTAKILK